MGDLGVLLDSTLLFCTILLLGSMGGFCSEKTGITNIGIDGTMCFGALFFGIFTSPSLHMNQNSLGNIAVFLPLIITMIVSTVIGALHAFACVTLKADHIIVGTAINVIGLAIGVFLTSPIGKSLYQGATAIKCGFDQFFHVAGGLYGSTIIFFSFALIILITLWIIMSKTRFGLRYQAVGENPNAVDAQGVNVSRIQWIGVIFSSMLAGAAGSIFLMNVQSFNGNVQSLGYLALVILIAAGWKLPLLLLFSFVFALFTAAANTNIFTRSGIISPEIIFCLPYIITLGILLFCSKNVLPPAHVGKHFQRDLR